MNTKEMKKLLEAQKLQTYFLLNKNEVFVFFNGTTNFEMKYNEDNILLAKIYIMQILFMHNILKRLIFGCRLQNKCD